MSLRRGQGGGAGDRDKYVTLLGKRMKARGWLGRPQRDVAGERATLSRCLHSCTNCPRPRPILQIRKPKA